MSAPPPPPPPPGYPVPQAAVYQSVQQQPLASPYPTAYSRSQPTRSPPQPPVPTPRFGTAMSGLQLDQLHEIAVPQQQQQAQCQPAAASASAFAALRQQHQMQHQLNQSAAQLKVGSATFRKIETGGKRPALPASGPMRTSTFTVDVPAASVAMQHQRLGLTRNGKRKKQWLSEELLLTKKATSSSNGNSTTSASRDPNDISALRFILTTGQEEQSETANPGSGAFLPSTSSAIVESTEVPPAALGSPEPSMGSRETSSALGGVPGLEALRRVVRTHDKCVNAGDEIASAARARNARRGGGGGGGSTQQPCELNMMDDLLQSYMAKVPKAAAAMPASANVVPVPDFGSTTFVNVQRQQHEQPQHAMPTLIYTKSLDVPTPASPAPARRSTM